MARLMAQVGVVLGTLLLALMGIVAFGAVTNADAAAKARLLAAGLREAVTCTPLLGIVAIPLLAVIAALWWARRKPRDETGR